MISLGNVCEEEDEDVADEDVCDDDVCDGGGGEYDNMNRRIFNAICNTFSP